MNGLLGFSVIPSFGPSIVRFVSFGVSVILFCVFSGRGDAGASGRTTAAVGSGSQNREWTFGFHVNACNVFLELF